MRPIRLTLIVSLTASPLFAATFTVTNTADSGAGSLRQAILDANANPGADTIAFDIPGAAAFTRSRRPPRSRASPIPPSSTGTRSRARAPTRCPSATTRFSRSSWTGRRLRAWA